VHGSETGTDGHAVTVVGIAEITRRSAHFPLASG
jgi:hypothetical protein